jgi:HK97 family phage prohead protease
MSHREIRALPGGFEIRTSDEGREVLAGYAAVFNSRSEDLGFREIIRPGAFARSLASGADVYALADHDASRRLARTANGSLRLAEDERGLRVEIDLPDTTLGRDILADIRSGLLDSMSFGFSTREDKWTREGGENVRELIDVDLFEVSVVTFPAYRDTSIDVARRSLAAWQAEGQRIHRSKINQLKRRLALAERA